MDFIKFGNTDTFEKMLDGKPNAGMSLTVTDAGWLDHAGIPTMLFVPGKLEDAHAVDEKVEIRQLQIFQKYLRYSLHSGAIQGGMNKNEVFTGTL